MTVVLCSWSFFSCVSEDDKHLAIRSQCFKSFIVLYHGTILPLVFYNKNEVCSNTEGKTELVGFEECCVGTGGTAESC